MITLCPFNAGLGDSLLMSTLPEMYARERGEKVDISTINYPWRNQGVPDLVWRTNPYVNKVITMGETGVYPLPGTIHISLGEQHNQLLIKYRNNIMAAEAFFGFEPKHQYPKIYWPTGYDENFRNKILLDAGASTNPFHKAAFEPFVKWQIENKFLDIKDMVIHDTPHSKWDKSIFPEIPRVESKDIFQFATWISSCKLFLTSEFGGAALASAIKGHNPYPKISAVMSLHTANTLEWKWNNIDYWYTGQMSGDF
jgi:hypothetical protein